MSLRRGSSSLLLFTRIKIAEIAQLVEHNLAKVGVASSSLVFRSKFKSPVLYRTLFFMVFCHTLLGLAKIKRMASAILFLKESVNFIKFIPIPILQLMPQVSLLILRWH